MTRGPGDDDGVTGDGVDHGEVAGEDRTTGPWGAWVLVLATAAPLGLWIDTARRVLTHGVFNGLEFFLGLPVTTTFAGRFASMLVTAPPSAPLGCAAVGVGTLAALTVAGRPAFLVPVALARRAAAALAALTALTAAAFLVLTVVYLTKPADPRTDRATAFAPGTADVPAAAPTTGVALFVLAVGVLATVVLLRRDAAPRPVPVEPDAPSAAAAVPAADDSAPEDRAPEDRAPEDRAERDPGPGVPAAGPLSADALPRPGADELARYRRPR
ncbi:hypothetical protein [Kineococcus rubinsiae]|uniref:hypothetical protein n=1 Tax=Kineococcus rubinsiae TaxID=2609562 RepID=UPI001AD90E3D|nr:hypothetical protein [Kineococcus rubinsiae]NIZ90426.1 hypothetical protein [Kineococcus rubinsiae]